MGGFAGFVLLRLRAHRLLVGAALVTILLTTSVLAALAGFTSGVADSGARRLLGTTDAAATPLLLSRQIGYPQRAESDPEARRLAAQTLPGLPLKVRDLAVSDGFGLPGGSAEDPDVTSLATLDRSELRLLQGSWPTDASPGGAVQIAVPKAAEQRLLQAVHGARLVGARITLTDRINKAKVTALVTGVYQARDTGDPYWQLDSLGGRGVQRSSGGGSGSTYGPMLTTDAAFRTGAVTQSEQSWLALPDVSSVHAGDLGRLADAGRASLAAISAKGEFQAVSSLPTVLDQLRRSLLVARSTLLVVVLQLVLLTVMTLLLAARLLTEEREGENALLRARGAAPRRLVRFAASEALLLALPAAVLAPLLAGPLTRLLASFGPLAEAGVRLDGPLPPSAWWTALLTALGCAVVVVAPTLARARSWSESRRARTRRAALPGMLRGGADLALVALAVAAYWQLRHYAGSGSGVLSSGLSGSLGIDPVLVAAPTLALAAGTVLTLRLLPLVARIGERIATRGDGLPAALAAWQLSRRSHRSAGPVLALALAAAIGTLAVGQNASWQRSQRDQAAFNTASDFRVASMRTPAFGQGGLLAALPGVAAAVPVNRQSIGVADGRLAELVAYDTRQEADRLPLRGDLADRSAAQLLHGLADPAPSPAERGVVLPGRPRLLTVDLRPTVHLAPGQHLSDTQLHVAVHVTDRYGLSYVLAGQAVDVDGATHRIRIDLAAAAGSGTPAYPLAVSRIDLSAPVAVAARPAYQQPHPTLHTEVTVGADGTPVAAPAGLNWQTRYDDSYGQSPGGAADPQYQQGKVLSARPFGSTALGLDLSLGTAELSDGSWNIPTVELSLSSARSAPAGPLPAVADRQFLSTSHAHVGSVLTLEETGGGLQVRITGVVKNLPGTGAAAEQGLNGQTLTAGSAFSGSDPKLSGGAVLVDLPSYSARLGLPGTANPAAALTPVEWWLAAAPGAQGRVAAALRTGGDVAVVYDRAAIATAAEHDPVGSGPQSALLAGLALAVVLAAVGFAANASGTVRARAGEFAVLRALGMSRRRLARATAAELALPVLLGLGVGLLLGELLTRLVVPLLVLTPQATRPVPAVLVDIPVLPLAGLLLAVAAVPLLCAALAGLRGGDPARRLRTPEEF